VTYTGGACNAVRALACCNAAPKTQFAGFTATPSTGALGGRVAAHATCDAEFPGARMCHAAEYIRAVSMVPVPAEGAWLDASADMLGQSTISGGPAFGRYAANTNGCLHWTEGTSSYTGTYLLPGGVTFTGGACNASRRIACCF
jgi:hypothetical protein